MAIWAIAGGWVEFRPLNGSDEVSVAGTSVLDALTLIDRLNVGRPGALVAPGDAVHLAAAVRDRALAWIYRQQYGDLVASSPSCVSCGERYDLSFDLPDLLDRHPMAMLSPDGVYQTEDGAPFRLPTGADELAVIGLPPQAARQDLLRRCMLSEAGDSGAVEAAMEAAAPLLSLDLEATCPECGVTQLLAFDMGTYLLRRLLSDKERLPNDVHILAMAYGWGHSDILGLTRSERRRYITLIEASAGAARSRAGGFRRRLG